MQIGKLGLQPFVITRGSADIARAARTCPCGVDRLVHRTKNVGMLAHTKVVIAAPHGDIALSAFAVGPCRVRKLTIAALDVDERPVAAFVMQPSDRVIQLRSIIHLGLSLACAPAGARAGMAGYFAYFEYILRFLRATVTKCRSRPALIWINGWTVRVGLVTSRQTIPTRRLILCPSTPC